MNLKRLALKPEQYEMLTSLIITSPNPINVSNLHRLQTHQNSIPTTNKRIRELETLNLVKIVKNRKFKLVYFNHKDPLAKLFRNLLKRKL